MASEAAMLDQVRADDDGSSDDSSESEDFEFIDDAIRCKVVCSEMLNDTVVAVDIEGVSLGRNGEICLIQIALRTGKVLLFDITTLGSAAFDAGLKALLESDTVGKLFFDCRSDADALFHLHGIRPNHVLDMQVLCVKANGGSATRLPGMVKAIGQVLPYVALQTSKGIKIAGSRLFAPDKGGSYEVWKKRPLPEILKTYCANDVVHLFTMFDKWKDLFPQEQLRVVSEERMGNRIDSSMLESGPKLALVDFVFPADAYNDGVDEPAAKKQKTQV